MAKATTIAREPHYKPYEVGQRFDFAVGDHVICNGYPGVVRVVLDGVCAGMVEVRLARGDVATGANYPDCYPRHECGFEFAVMCGDALQRLCCDMGEAERYEREARGRGISGLYILSIHDFLRKFPNYPN